ncbi:MAG: HAD family hydrolase [Puniceicoccaceae bacterium]
MNPEFSRYLDGVDILSLDIFDTTLGRRCGLPEDVFTLMEEQLVHNHGDLYQGFGHKRRDIDSLARRRAWDTRQAEEVSLNDIHSLLLELNPEWRQTAGELAALEMQIEEQVLYPLEGAREMIHAAREQGKKVIFISDMYLPQEFCERMLTKNGFTDYDQLFLSSSIGVLKHSGKLFEHVLEELEVPPEQILHVGDNAHSDGEQPQRLGLRTFIVGKSVDYIERFPRNPLSPLLHAPKRNRGESLLLGTSAIGCRCESQREDPFWWRIGYQVGGPLLYGYVQFILNKVRGRDIPKIYFLSRDGYILKRVYELLATGQEDCPRADYLYASRRALNLASIVKLDQTTEDWLAQGIHLKVSDFLGRIGLDPDHFKDAIESCGFKDAQQLVVEGADYDNLRRLIRWIEPSIMEAAERERSVYMQYLEHKDVLASNPFLMVDVGWMTSIQQSFHKLIHPRYPGIPIEGYYIGTYPHAVERLADNSRHVHYLMSYGQPGSAWETIRHCVCLVEFFFAAPERTFIRMTGNPQEGFSPELAPFHENEEDLPALKQIHAGIIDFVQGMQAAAPGEGLQLNPEVVLEQLHRLLAEPTHQEAVRLGDLRYADGYGAIFHHSRMARPTGFGNLGLSKKKWKREFKHCHWPKGWYERLNIVERIIFKRMHPSAKFCKPIW